eukprot:scaffold101651_cov45-Phaeocystis_antarctica.AAC.1
MHAVHVSPVTDYLLLTSSTGYVPPVDEEAGTHEGDEAGDEDLARVRVRQMTRTWLGLGVQ